MAPGRTTRTALTRFFALLRAHRKALFRVDPVDKFMIDPPSLSAQQHVQPSISIPNPNRCKVSESNPQERLLIPCVAPVVEHRPMHLEKPARAPLVDLVGGNQILRQRALAGRP
jgi:hypothetical protein